MEQATVMKKVSLAKIVPGDNPRKFFDQQEMQELADSIAANGILQPPVVRPAVDDCYAIVAGERRVRAARIAFGEAGEIDVLVRELSDEEADILALVENVARADMSPTEEAEAAHKLLLRLRDKVETALQLGWPLGKLERRLALMQCAPEVRTALNERRLMLGHAELLAALAADKQQQVLARILDLQLSVPDLKKSLAGFAQRLDAAIFDQKDCLNCQYNSGQQAALFAESIGEGCCTHASCYQQKTDEHLETVKLNLESEENRVEFLEATEAPVITIKLLQDGVNGVGEDQFAACKSCANCGATVSKLPTSLGQVERGICFDATCHGSKVTVHQQALASSLAPAVEEEMPDGENKEEGLASAPSPKPVTKPAIAPAVASIRPSIV